MVSAWKVKVIGLMFKVIGGGGRRDKDSLLLLLVLLLLLLTLSLSSSSPWLSLSSSFFLSILSFLF